MICSISVTIRLCLRPLHNYLQNTFPPSGYNTAWRFLLMRPFAAVVYRGTWLSGWWCNEPITDVVRRLNLSADGEAGMNLLARSAVTQARQRVGAAPVEWLFRQTAQTGARNVT